MIGQLWCPVFNFIYSMFFYWMYTDTVFPHIDFTWAGRPNIFGDTYLSYYYLLHLYYPPELMKPSAIDELLESLPSLYTFRTTRSVCSRTVHTPTENLQCFPYIGLFVAGHIYPPPAAISCHVSHTRVRLSGHYESTLYNGVISAFYLVLS